MEVGRTMASTEMLKLDALLTITGTPHETSIIMIGEHPSLQIHVPSLKEAKADAVCHEFSYGGTSGKIEVMCDGEEDVVGWLDAAEAFNYMIKAI